MVDDLDVAGLRLHPTTSGSGCDGAKSSNDISNGKAGVSSDDTAHVASGATRMMAASSSSNAGPKLTGPIPMTMPSILRNRATSSTHHLSYLVNQSASTSASSSSSYPPASSSRNTRSRSGNTKELGRRKQRRSENLRLLSSNTARPTLKDYRLHTNTIRSTFSACTASRNEPVPSSSKATYSEPQHDAQNATQGHFGKSLRDAQRVLKRVSMDRVDDEMIMQGRAGELERFIWLVDREIRTWCNGDVFVFAPQTCQKTGKVLLDDGFNITTWPLARADHSSTDTRNHIQAEAPSVQLDSVTPGNWGGQLVEFQRTPNALVWLVHDPFLRLIVHCLARVSRCPSFSKDDASRAGLRFTWILNPNPLARRGRRGRRVSVSSSAISTADLANAAEATTNAVRRIPPAPGVGALQTPPMTDFDSQTESEIDTDTEAGSLGGSMVIVAPASTGVQTERIADQVERDAADTDEEEAEILRRVTRWAIDSHRRRARQEEEEQQARPPDRSAQDNLGCSTKRAVSHDPDQTLTATAIDETDEFDDDDDEADEFGDDDDEVFGDSEDDHDTRSFSDA